MAWAMSQKSDKPRERGGGYTNDHLITFSKTDHEGEGSKMPKILFTWFMDDPILKMGEKR